MAMKKKQHEDWDVRRTSDVTTETNPKVMFYNMYRGGWSPDMSGGQMTEPASLPVRVLFNENSSYGEVRPEEDAVVVFSRDGKPYSHQFLKGENLVLGINDLSARPLPGFEEYVDKYADDLYLPKGKEKPVDGAAKACVERVIAANHGIPDMTGHDGDKLYRHMAYGDVLYTGTPHQPLNQDFAKYAAMEELGDLLNDKHYVFSAGMLLQCQYAAGSFEEPAPEQQRADAAYIAPVLKGKCDEYMIRSFQPFMENHPSYKPAFAKALAEHWANIDDVFDGDQRPHSGATELAFMHMACKEMGYDLVPSKEDAKALDGMLDEVRTGSGMKEFSAMLERSLTEHPQPQAQKGTPDTPKKGSSYDALKAMLADGDREEGRSRGAGMDGLEL